jgi:signal peptidase I
MNKQTWAVLSVAVLIILGFALHYSRILAIREVGNNMQPELSPGSIVLVSKWKPYSRGDVVSVKYFAERGENQLYTLAALEGDTVEINDSHLLRNGFLADKPSCLRLNYYIKRRLITHIDEVKPFLESLKDDTVVIGLSKIQCMALERNWVLRRYGSLASRCFGPVVVPKGMCFLLSNNRDNCKDSRHFGFVPVSLIESVKL